MLIMSDVALADLNTGLIAYYPFNGNANDESGQGKDGDVFGGASLTTDRFGNANSAYLFNGTSSYININLPTINTAIDSNVTMSFWIKWDGKNDGLPFGFESYDLWFSSGYFGFNTDQSDLWGTGSKKLANHWSFVTAIFNNGDITKSSLYIDGVKSKLTQKLGSPITKFVSTNARIGYYFGGCSFCYFGGSIDDVRIYNRALTGAEIVALYDQSIPVSGTVKSLGTNTVVCKNETTGQTVEIASSKAKSYDCEAKGLNVKAGETASIFIKGVVQ